VLFPFHYLLFRLKDTPVSSFGALCRVGFLFPQEFDPLREGVILKTNTSYRVIRLVKWNFPFFCHFFVRFFLIVFPTPVGFIKFALTWRPFYFFTTPFPLPALIKNFQEVFLP